MAECPPVLLTTIQKEDGNGHPLKKYVTKITDA